MNRRFQPARSMTSKKETTPSPHSEHGTLLSYPCPSSFHGESRPHLLTGKGLHRPHPNCLESVAKGHSGYNGHIGSPSGHGFLGFGGSCLSGFFESWVFGFVGPELGVLGSGDRWRLSSSISSRNSDRPLSSDASSC